MKKIFILVFFVTISIFVSFSALGQTKKQDALKEKIAEDVCDCISDSNVDLNNGTAVEEQLGECLMAAIMVNEAKITKTMDLDFEDSKQIEGFVKDIALTVGVKCPKIFMNMIGKKMDDDDKYVFNIEATIEGVEEGTFMTILVKDEEGNSHQLLWLEQFDNDDQLEGDADSLKGKTLKIEYEERKYYNPKTKKYTKVKVIQDIEVD